MRFGSRGLSEFSTDALTEVAWEEVAQGLGIMSTVASEKNKEMLTLFIGNVFYKQCHLCVLFH